MLKRVLEALSALIGDDNGFGRLLSQMKAWGQTQEEARKRLISVLTNLVVSFETAHALVVAELSKLTFSTDAADYRATAKNLDVGKLTQLFKANGVCENLHQLEADLSSGFGDVADSVVLGALNQLRAAIGDLQQWEYSLATRYEDHLTGVLYGVRTIKTDADVEPAVDALIAEQRALQSELQELTDFKRKVFSLAFKGTPIPAGAARS